MPCNPRPHPSQAVPNAQRVGYFNIGSGRVLEKITDSGSGSECRNIQPGIFVYFFHSRVFPGIPGYFRVFLGILDIISFLEVVSQTLRFFLTFTEAEKIAKIHKQFANQDHCREYPEISGNTRNSGFTRNIG